MFGLADFSTFVIGEAVEGDFLSFDDGHGGFAVHAMTDEGEQLVDKANPGLTALFVDAFRQQTEPEKTIAPEKTEERDPEVVAWENDEITSIEVKTVEVKSPFAPLPEEAAKAPKAHRLTAEEKEIKAAVMDTLKGQIAYNNDGMRASYRASNHSFNLLARNGVRIEGNTVTQNGEPLFKIHRRHAARKTQGCYR